MSDVDNRLNSPRTSTINRPAGPRTPRSSYRKSLAPTNASGSTRSSQDFLTLGAMSLTRKPLPSHPKPLPTISTPGQSASFTVSPFDPPPEPEDGLMVSGALPMNRSRSFAPSSPSMQGKYSPSVNNEEPTSPMAAPAYHANDHIQPDVEPATPPAKVTVVHQALPKLTPPPPILFDSATVPWKGMSLEPALWTFDSAELQEIVSRAIRLSAKESFIRLLTIENLDKILPAELERLRQLKITTQARYRFLVQRRTMLFYAFHTSSIGPKKGEENDLLVSRLTAQLTETIADCDKRLEELFGINDQIAQVNKLFDVHSSSALAIALRKLNSSYARRTRDLNKARQRIFQLEAEIEDAWKEAEKLANELDEYEASGADDAIIETAEIVAVPKSPSQSPPPLMNVGRRSSVPMQMTPTLLTVKTISPTLTSSTSPQTATASSMRDFVFPPPVPKDRQNDDAVSIRSWKSVRSAKSTKSGKGFSSSLHAAKTRSSRASQSSLRLSISSTHHGRGPSGEVPPPMPEIPPHLVNAVHGSETKSDGRWDKQSEHVSLNSFSTALYYAAGSRLTHGNNGSIYLRRVKKHTSLDALPPNNKRRSAAIDAYRGKAADDIYVMTGDSRHGHSAALQSSMSPYSSDHAYVDLSWDDDSEIQAVPRTPPYRIRTISGPKTDNIRSRHMQGSDIPPVPTKDSSRTLPSSWKDMDAVTQGRLRPQISETFNSPLPSLPEFGVLPHAVPSGNSAAVPSTEKPELPRRSKTLQIIKGFTKRYSASIPPIFHGKPSLKKTR